MTKLQITFIHELGHHIANELNYRLFHFDRRTKSIHLYPSEHGNFFDGKTISRNANKDYYLPENTPLEYIRSFYGCLFESLLRDINIDKCLCGYITPLDIKVNLCKGRADYYQMASISMRPEVKNRFEWWRYLTNDYFKLMKNKIGVFKTVFHLNVLDFISNKDNDRHKIDLNRLNLVIEPFLINHQKDFKMAVEKLKFLASQ